MVFVSNNQSPEVLKPGKQALNLPSAPVTPQFSAVLGSRFFSAHTVRCNHFNTALIEKLIVKFIAVVGFIANQFIRRIPRKAAIYSGLDKLYLMGRSAFNVSGDRKTRSVCDGHDLGALAAFRLADSKTPFFAGAKLPSMNASRISILPRSYRSSASSWTIRWKIPCRTHCWNRLWHVWYGGYRWGRSFQGAPVLRIHIIPFNTSRGSLGRRPLGSFNGVKDEITGSIRFHCSFVSSILILLHIQFLMSRFFFEIACSINLKKISGRKLSSILLFLVKVIRI